MGGGTGRTGERLRIRGEETFRPEVDARKNGKTVRAAAALDLKAHVFLLGADPRFATGSGATNRATFGPTAR
jgi:hypothetical protein